MFYVQHNGKWLMQVSLNNNFKLKFSKNYFYAGVIINSNLNKGLTPLNGFAGAQKISEKQKMSDMQKISCAPNSENLEAYYMLNFSDTSFGGTRITRKNFPLTIYHDKISCPCCGEKMINFNQQETEAIAKNISKKTGDELVSELLTNIKEFQYSKRELIEKLAGVAPKYPEKNISELLGIISGEYIESLRKKQKNVIYQMTNELNNKKPSKKAVFTNWQNQQIERITNAQNEGDFKNSYLVKSFADLAGKHNINKTLNFYYDKLPNSAKDIDAFVIKYQRRSPYETSYELIKNTTPTVEHIVPFSKSKNNDYGNLLLMCSDCNKARGNIKYSEFLNLYPEMKQNINKYFKDINRLVQKQKDDYKLREMCKTYIANVQDTLNQYTDGKLCSSNSTAKENRRAKKYKFHIDY